MFKNYQLYIENWKKNISYVSLVLPPIIFILAIRFSQKYAYLFFNEDAPPPYSQGYAIFNLFCAIGFIYSIVIGTFTVLNIFSEEFRLNSWERIKISKITPKELLMSKVLGGNFTIILYTLILIVPCIVISFIICTGPYKEFLVQHQLHSAILLTVCLISWICLSYMLAISSYLFCSLTMRVSKLSTILLPILALNIFIGATISKSFSLFYTVHDYSSSYRYHSNPNNPISLGNDLFMSTPDKTSWFGYEFLSFTLYTGLITFFAACSIIGCYRTLQLNLNKKLPAILWIPFCILSSVVIGGITKHNNQLFDFNQGIFYLFTLTIIVFALEAPGKKLSHSSCKPLSKKEYIKYFNTSPLYHRTILVFSIFIILNYLVYPSWKSSLFHFSLIGFLLRDFITLKVLSNIKKLEWETSNNIIYFTLIYVFFPFLTFIPQTKSTKHSILNPLYPAFPEYNSNYFIFFCLLSFQIGFWLLMLFAQRKRLKSIEEF